MVMKYAKWSYMVCDSQLPMVAYYATELHLNHIKKTWNFKYLTSDLERNI